MAFAVETLKAFSVIFFNGADADVAALVGAKITKPGHDVFATTVAALIPSAAGIPNCPPLIEAQQERDAALPRIILVYLKGIEFQIGLALRTLKRRFNPRTLPFLFWIFRIPPQRALTFFLAMLRGLVVIRIFGAPASRCLALACPSLLICHKFLL